MLNVYLRAPACVASVLDVHVCQHALESDGYIYGQPDRGMLDPACFTRNLVHDWLLLVVVWAYQGQTSANRPLLVHSDFTQAELNDLISNPGPAPSLE